MALLETQNELETTATSSRFFIEENYTGPGYPENAQAVYSHDEMFWLKHCIDLPDTSASILQAGLSDESLVDIRDPHDRVITLVFDPSNRQTGKYTWELVCAEIHGPREVLRLDVTPGDIQAKNYEYDSQGVLRKISSVDPHQVACAVSSLTKSELLAKKVAEHEKKREKFEAELAVAAVAGILRYAERLHEKKINDIEERISKVGFSPMTLQTKTLPNT